MGVFQCLLIDWGYIYNRKRGRKLSSTSEIDKRRFNLFGLLLPDHTGCIGSRSSNLVIEYEAYFRWHLCTSHESLCPTLVGLKRFTELSGTHWESRWKPETSVCVTKQGGRFTACWWLFKVFDKGFIPVQKWIKLIHFLETFYNCMYMHLYVG